MPELSSLSAREFVHPYLDVLPESEWLWGWQEPNAFAGLFAGKRSPLLVVLGGQRQDIEFLLNHSLSQAPECRITVQRKFSDLLTGEISNWDWMGIFDPADLYLPKMSIEDLGKEHDEEINAFLAEASPSASTPAGDPEILTWHGIRDQHGLVSVGAATRWRSGAAVLVSIATHPRGRGKGYATEVTASLSRMFFEAGHSRVTLGLYADNHAARQTYLKVGYRMLENFSSSSRP